MERIKDKTVHIHDPVVDPNKIKYGTYFKSIDECIRNVDVLIISTPWEEYKKIDLNKLKNKMNGNVIIDPFRVLNSKLLIDLGFQYHTLGI